MCILFIICLNIIIGIHILLVTGVSEYIYCFNWWDRLIHHVWFISKVGSGLPLYLKPDTTLDMVGWKVFSTRFLLEDHWRILIWTDSSKAHMTVFLSIWYRSSIHSDLIFVILMNLSHVSIDLFFFVSVFLERDWTWEWFSWLFKNWKYHFLFIKKVYNSVLLDNKRCLASHISRMSSPCWFYGGKLYFCNHSTVIGFSYSDTMCSA